MATFSSETASTARRSHLIRALAPRAARVVGGLLLAGLLLLPVNAFVTAGVPLGAAPVIVVGLFLLTLVRPQDGLLVCAGLLVLSGPLAAIVHCDPSLTEPLLLAFLGGWVLREATRRQSPADRATRSVVTPAMLLAAVVAASMLVQLTVQQVFVDYPWPFFRQVVAHLGSDYIVFGSRFPGLDRGGAMLEGIALFMAAVILGRHDPRVARRAAEMAAAGAAGVAALNISRFGALWLRTGVLTTTFLDFARNSRVSSVFADVNSAGSYLAMALLLTLGLAVSARRVRRWAWIGSASLVLLALWLTGSRAALLAVPAAIVIVLLARARAAGTWSWREVLAGITTVVIAIALLGWVFWFAPPGRTIDVLTMQWRARLNLAALKAAAAHPVFGVGVGRYWTVSGDYMGPALRTVFTHENAHDNFLQVLAELGIAGLVPFLFILYGVGRRARRATIANRDPLLLVTATGMLAFLLTWLAGHPLLIREVAYPFWMVLGIVAALSMGPCAAGESVPTPARWRRWIVGAMVVGLIVSVPIRAHLFLDNEANLDQAAIGFSQWTFDDRGVRYRTMTDRAEFYIPGSTCEIRLPLRVEAGDKRPWVDVEISVDGRPANGFRAVQDSWRDVRLVLRVDSGRRFRKVELRTSPDANAALRTGRPALVDCRTNPF